MTTVNIEGVGRVNLSDDFLSLSHEEQNKTIEEIAAQAKGTKVASDIKNMSALDVAKTSISNIPSSAAQYGKDLIQPFVHPIETTENLAKLGKGVLQKVGLISGEDAVPNADAVGQFLKERYGSLAAIKKTIAEDPVGLAADLSLLLSAGRSAGQNAPGVIGRVARVAGEASRVIDPVNVAAKGVTLTGKVAAKVLGATTGAGSEAIEIAAQAGREGGSAAKAFRENLTGTAPIDSIVDDARAAVGKLKRERGDEYVTEMQKIGADKTVLAFTRIKTAVNDVANVKTYKGQSLSPSTAAVRQTISEAVNDWEKLNPKEFHTAEGLDALKQKIGDIRDGTQYGTPDRLVADKVYNSIKKTIADQVPEYAKIMKGYEEASDLIREIEGTLSLKPDARIDTALRKLQSTLRNNVSTNYGKRGELVKFLQAAGAKNLLAKIAGQTLNTATPRGLMKAVAGGEGLAALGAAVLGNPALTVSLGGGLLASSPALVGGAAYGAGVASRLPLRTIGRSAFQVGRLAQ